jgi:hypothetical protein
MSGEIFKPDGQAPKPPVMQIGRQGDHVLMAINGRPIAEFSAPEAAFMAATLIKHACSIAAGVPFVQKAMQDVYGAVDPGPIILRKDRIPPPSPPGNS